MAEQRDWFSEIQVLSELMTRFYLDAPIGERVNARLRERLNAGAYGDTTDERAFAEAVTKTPRQSAAIFTCDCGTAWLHFLRVRIWWYLNQAVTPKKPQLPGTGSPK